MSEKRTEKIGPPKIKVAPMKGLIFVEPIKVMSLYEKKAKKKNPNVILTHEQIATYNKQVLESSKNALDIWDENPDQGIIVAIDTEVAENYDLRIGDHVSMTNQERQLFIYNKKRYYALRPSENLFRYLTDEV